MIWFQIASISSAILVFLGLLYIALRRPEFVVKPSVIFTALFFLQVQAASAVNAPQIYQILTTSGQTFAAFMENGGPATHTTVKLKPDDAKLAGVGKALRVTPSSEGGEGTGLTGQIRLAPARVRTSAGELRFSAFLESLSGATKFKLTLAAPSNRQGNTTFAETPLTRTAGGRHIGENLNKIFVRFSISENTAKTISEKGLIVNITGRPLTRGWRGFDLAAPHIDLPNKPSQGLFDNLSYVADRVEPAVAYATLVHFFPLALLIFALNSNKKFARAAHSKLHEAAHQTSLQFISIRLCIMLILTYSILGLYFLWVPPWKTGLYAAAFEPALYEPYRELSLKLLDEQWLKYLYVFMEKVFAPLSAALAAMLVGRAWIMKRYTLVAAGLILLSLAILPTMITGARGPASMVFMVFIVTILLVFVRRFTIPRLTLAFVICLAPAIAIGTLKSGTVSLNSAAQQTFNIIDRAIGRTYIDNVYHVVYAMDYGYHGIAGIPKLATILGKDPENILNIVGREFKFQSYGLSFLGSAANSLNNGNETTGAESASYGPLSDDPDIRQYQIRARELDLNETVSAGAAFHVLNFGMFGWLSVLFSFLFIATLDFLVVLYGKVHPLAVAIISSTLTLPLLALCFTMMTTVMLSKGLFLIPVVGYLLSLMPKRGGQELTSNHPRFGART